MLDEILSGRIENYWNERSEDFSRVRRLELEGRSAATWLDLILKRLPQRKPLKFLDVGTGAGFFAVLLAKCGHDVTGVDMSPKMLNEARKNVAAFDCRADFIRMNAQALNFANETFDAVLSRNLTWTLPDVMEAYREWHRVLKVGGVLINFDSDYGDKNFTNESTCAKGEVEDEMLVECTAIKNSLRISTHARPAWDINFLNELGFAVSCDFDVAPLVHIDKNIPYDSIPLFAIYAAKGGGD